MIAETGLVLATFTNNIPYRVIAWDDDGYAMIATGHGHLERAIDVPGFNGLDQVQAARHDIVHLIPAHGERITYPSTDEADPTMPVLAWGLTRDGVVVPLSVDGGGNVEQEYDNWTVAMSHNRAEIRRDF